MSCVFFTLLILLFICAIRFLPHINLSLGNDPGDDGGGGGSGGKDGPTIIITGGSNAYKTGFDFAQGMDKGDPANSWKYQDKGNRN